MHYKHPEILYFLLLLLVPILVHLFQLRRFKKTFFTNVRLLKTIQIQSRKSSKIKKWLLLACRLLFLFFLILAFAQPFFISKKQASPAKELYFILDNSYSMQAKGKKGELLQRAVQELLETTPKKRSFSLLTNTDAFWNTDIQSVQQALQNITYSAKPFELEPLLSQINRHASASSKEIVVITDGLGLKLDELKKTVPNSSISFIIPKAEQQNNLAIDSVFIRKHLADFYEIGVRVRRYGKDRNPVSIGLYNQNKLLAKTRLTLKTQDQIIPFSIAKKAFQGYVALSDNGLAFDNRFYFSISETTKTRVLSIGEASKSDFLSRIFTPDEFEYQNAPIAQLDYSQLEKQDAIVLNELDQISQALQTTLSSFLSKGGALILVPSAKATVTDLNSLLPKKDDLRFQSLEQNEKMISQIHFEHPVLKPVFENRISNFQYPKTKLNFVLTGASSVVLSYQDQSSFLVSSTQGAGRLSVFSAPLNVENSNFQQSPLIVPVFYQLAQSLEKKGVEALTIGDSSPYFVKANLDKDHILTLKNKDEQFIPLQQILNATVQLNFGSSPKQAGNFGVFTAEKWIKNTSFNYDRSESNLFQNNKKQLSELPIIASLATVFDRMQTQTQDSQLWKWFVIFAMLFLIVEMAIIRY